MSKTLITVDNIKDFIDEDGTQVTLPLNSIITPLAKDYARKNKLEILSPGQSPRPKADESKSFIPSRLKLKEDGDEAKKDLPLDKTIMQILRKDYGLVKEEKVQKIARLVVNALKNQS